MDKIKLSENKVLKLTNVLMYKINTMDQDTQLEVEVEKMQSYIKVKGATSVGPLIQYMEMDVNKKGEIDFTVMILFQCNTYIHHVEYPYSMQPIVRVPNCMYCRYIGPEEKLNFAYQKIQLEAFENDIPLKGDSYTIFVDRNDENDTITVDVFMERAD